MKSGSGENKGHQAYSARIPFGSSDGNDVSDEKWMKSPVNLLATHPESNHGNWVSDIKLRGLCAHWTTLIRHFIGREQKSRYPSHPTFYFVLIYNKRSTSKMYFVWRIMFLSKRYFIRSCQNRISRSLFSKLD